MLNLEIDIYKQIIQQIKSTGYIFWNADFSYFKQAKCVGCDLRCNYVTLN